MLLLFYMDFLFPVEFLWPNKNSFCSSEKKLENRSKLSKAHSTKTYSKFSPLEGGNQARPKNPFSVFKYLASVLLSFLLLKYQNLILTKYHLNWWVMKSIQIIHLSNVY